jgi:hypothetical protein
MVDVGNDDDVSDIFSAQRNNSLINGRGKRGAYIRKAPEMPPTRWLLRASAVNGEPTQQEHNYRLRTLKARKHDAKGILNASQKFV